ncbi:MAG: hypothetical protein K0Q55_4064, partial [Verrucomicrobia bacterium]|nr:hypothetical protein [Verrucomicrobiota bacterium]
VAFVWMKTWHAVFIASVKEHLTGLRGDPWTLGRWIRCFCQQAAFQPTAFIVLPFTAIIALPFAWAIAFYQNLSWTADGREEGLRQLYHRNWQVSCQWPGQNHKVLVWLTIFGFFVIINVMLMFNFIPSMLKTLLGVETVWTQGGWSMMNTTLWASCVAVSWVCLDPLIKTVYALRCFYGEALSTGEDLKAEIRSLRRAPAVAVIWAAALFLLSPLSTTAAESVPAASPEQVEKLDHAIKDVLSQRRYEWRLPPTEDEAQLAQISWMQKMLQEIQTAVADSIKAVVKQLVRFKNWLSDLFPKPKPKAMDGSKSSIDWMGGLRILLFVLLAAVAAALVVFFWRYWSRQKTSTVLTAQAIPARPDLTDENISAADLPENEWLAMAREQIAAGNLRLALRAFYLAGLAHLGERELLKITRFKSNQEYVRELERRARSKPELLTVFGDTVMDFERAWYGRHEVTPESMGEYQRKVERILAC